MSLVTEVSDLATAVGTEIKDVRSDTAAVTGALGSLDTTDKTNLVNAINETLGVAEAGGSSGVTNLGATLSATNTIITSDTGTDATIPAADTTNAGVMTKAMFDKLGGIATSADVTATSIAPAINGATAKSTPVDADLLGIVDTEASNVLKKLTVGNLKNLVIAAVSAGAPATLDTIDEIAAALGDDPNAITSITTALANRLRVDTAAQGLNGTQQSNGRTNLDVYSKAEIGDPATDFVAIFNAALV